jgi:hypothetical protein
MPHDSQSQSGPHSRAVITTTRQHFAFVPQPAVSICSINACLASRSEPMCVLRPPPRYRAPEGHQLNMSLVSIHAVPGVDLGDVGLYSLGGGDIGVAAYRVADLELRHAAAVE